jgi:para-nitrobenzyl esterase
MSTQPEIEPKDLAAPVAETAAGRVRGSVDAGVASFLGIPYGADTGGASRFKAPLKRAAWPGVRDALSFGPRAPQLPSQIKGEISTVMFFSGAPVDEDCLVLNLWTPAVDKASRPVMVWLHGGGFSIGTGAETYYHGANLARQNDVVVVTLNHRLNVFGFLDLAGELGPDYAASGNAGMWDILLALEWVRDNIASFGGDAGNVTIFGESGGGAKVGTLLGIPRARGLFHKAIIMSSGITLKPQLQKSPVAEAVLQQFSGTRQEQLAKLRGVSTLELLQTASKARFKIAGPPSPLDTLFGGEDPSGFATYGPLIDGDLIPAPIFVNDAPEIYADVPMMIGTTADEATTIAVLDPAWPAMDQTTLAKKLSSVFGEALGRRILTVYAEAAPHDDPAHLWSSILSDMIFTTAAIRNSELKAAQRRAPVYMYKLAWGSPVIGGKLRAGHGVDMPLFFDNVETSRPLVGPGDEPVILAKSMSRAIAAFARSGNPDVEGHPHWPKYDAASRQTMIFDTTLRVEGDPGRAKRELWSTMRK